MIDHELMMNGTVRIGMKTPNFEAITTMGNVSLENYRGKWVILFSHPRRFYSCIHNFQTSIKFKKSNKKIIKNLFYYFSIGF